MSAVTYETILKYLDAIDLKGNKSASNAPHDVFWKDSQGNNLPLATFKGLSIAVPNGPVKIFDAGQPDQSPLYLILLGPWNGRPQMPKTGPFITDTNPDYSVDIGGTTVTGSQIKRDLLAWIRQEFPHKPS